MNDKANDVQVRNVAQLTQANTTVKNVVDDAEHAAKIRQLQNERRELWQRWDAAPGSTFKRSPLVPWRSGFVPSPPFDVLLPIKQDLIRNDRALKRLDRRKIRQPVETERRDPYAG